MLGEARSLPPSPHRVQTGPRLFIRHQPFIHKDSAALMASAPPHAPPPTPITFEMTLKHPDLRETRTRDNSEDLKGASPHCLPSLLPELTLSIFWSFTFRSLNPFNFASPFHSLVSVSPVGSLSHGSLSAAAYCLTTSMRLMFRSSSGFFAPDFHVLSFHVSSLTTSKIFVFSLFFLDCSVVGVLGVLLLQLCLLAGKGAFLVFLITYFELIFSRAF